MTKNSISVIEAATLLEVSESYIRRLLRLKRINGKKLGQRTWIVSRQSVEAYRAARSARKATRPEGE